jgi:hypothetical protein
VLIVSIVRPWDTSSARSGPDPSTAASVPLPPLPHLGVPVVGPGGPSPLFPSDVPDPYILRVGSVYYMYATQPWQESTNVPLRVSADLVHWRILGDAMPTLPRWAAPGRTWAPSILVRGHSYVMYFTAQQSSSGRQCIGTATSRSPVGPFVPDPTILECQVSEHGGSIDAQVFLAPTGAPYLFWKSDDNAIHRPSTLWGAQLRADGLALVGTPVAMIHDDEPWEHYTIEAPAMLYRAGHFWLFYSGNYLGSSSYAIGYALCAGPLGPCAKQSVSAPWYGTGPDRTGPGEESFFTDAQGNTWISYNAWPTTGTGYAQGFVRYPHVELIRFRPSSPPTVSPTAVAVAASPKGGYYVLSADGGVEAIGAAPSYGSAAVPDDLARAMAVMPDGLGYAVLDGHGRLYLFGSATHLKVDPAIAWPNIDIARGLVITPTGEGYAVLDGLGGVHPGGDAPPAPPVDPSGPEVARSLAISPSGHGYAVLDGDGSIHPSGDAPPTPTTKVPWPGFDLARSLVISRSGQGYAMLDELGDITTYGDAPPAPRGEPSLGKPMGTWAGLALLGDGHYAVLRTDSFSAIW